MSADRLRYDTLDTPLGCYLLAATPKGLRLCKRLPGGADTADERLYKEDGLGKRDPDALADYTQQLSAYFKGELKTFEGPLDLVGTEFQRSCWEALLQVPYGETISYGEEALRIGNPKAAQAVGQANGRNPISIIVPCHRVISGDGSLGGYTGGLDIKRRLLALEQDIDSGG